ncbi:MAG: magnesium transporter CorA family protein [Chloroflexota bacterium]
MIKFYNLEDGVKEIYEYVPGCWINTVNPSAEEIVYLMEKFGIPEDYITDVLDLDERSRTESEDGNQLIIIRVPVFNAEHTIPYTTVPLGVILHGDTMITISYTQSEVITDILNQRARPITSNKRYFVLDVFNRSSNYFMKYMKELNRKTSIIEKDLRKSIENDELNILIKIQKCLVYFMTSLKSNELLLYKLQHTRFAGATEDDLDLVDDAVIEVRQAVEMAKIYMDILTGMMDAFASVISNNLNIVMKRLTSITIVLMLPTLVASLFGMNVPNGMEEYRFAFLAVLVISTLLSTFALIVFRKSKLL